MCQTIINNNYYKGNNIVFWTKFTQKYLLKLKLISIKMQSEKLKRNQFRKEIIKEGERYAFIVVIAAAVLGTFASFFSW